VGIIEAGCANRFFILERISIVSGKIWTSDWVAPLSISSAVTLPQSEEIRIRSCAIAGSNQSERDDEGFQESIQQVQTSIFGFPPGDRSAGWASAAAASQGRRSDHCLCLANLSSSSPVIGSLRA
jgi:hypothetical protein